MKWLASPRHLRELGQIDFVIRLTYVIFLGVIGILMVVESVRLTLRKPGASRSRLFISWPSSRTLCLERALSHSY